MSIQAIETEFKGIMFRSRNEAKWAVFFETLGIRWEYEPQGYEVGVRKVRYLPDFYIPIWDKFIETKPLRALEVSEIEKAGLLVQYTGKPLLFLAGQPWPGDYITRLIVPSNIPGIKAPFTAAFIPEDKTGQFAIAPHSERLYVHYRNEELPFICMHLDLVIDDEHLLMLMNRENANFLLEDTNNGIFTIEGSMASIDDLLKIDTLLARAYIAARQARFEFGQTGKSIDKALKLKSPLSKGESPYFSTEVLAQVRAFENDALKGKGGNSIVRPYVLGECIAAWVQPGAMVTVRRLNRGIRLREYRNPERTSDKFILIVIDFKTEEIFETWKARAANTLNNIAVLSIEYDNSYQILAFAEDHQS
jgi:hypothetical protein